MYYENNDGFESLDNLSDGRPLDVQFKVHN